MGLRDRLGFRSPLQAQLERVPTVAVRERRDPTAATLPLSYQSKGAPMVAEWDAEQAMRWAYLANVFVFACVRAIATDIASLPFRAGADPDRPLDFNPRARLAQLLGPPPLGPAPKLSARRLWAWTIAQRLVTGRMAWETELAQRTSGQVVALWPLATSRLRAIPSEGGTGWFSRFEYGRQDQPRKLTPEQVFYAWSPSQADFRQPESALQAARLDISVAVMQDRYDYAFLRNDARPAAVVVTEAFAERSEYDAFKDQWRGEYRGPENAGKTAFLEASDDAGGTESGVKGAIHVEVLGLSQKDAAFIERYEAKVRNICVGLGVPMSRLMDASKRTFSNADRETVNYWQTTIKTIATDIQDDVNLDLAPRLGSEVGWFDFSKIEALKPPRKFTTFSLRDLIDEEIVSREEVREDFGLTGPAPTPKPTIAPVPTDQPAVSALAEAMANQVDAAVSRAIEAAEARHPHPVIDHELRRARVWRAVDAQAKALERGWQRRWRAEFRRQEEATVKRLRRGLGRQASAGETRAVNPDDIFDQTFWTSEAEDLAAGLYEAVFAVGGARLAERFGLAFDIEAPYAQYFITTRANRLAGQVTSTTYDAIKAQLAEGSALGEGIDALAERVRHVFGVASDSRATTIARTEVISAFNGSATEVALNLAADIIGGQEWIATSDDRTRDDHAEADGQVVGLADYFDVGGEALQYPGDGAGSPENTVNCRCTIAFLTPEEMEGRAKPHEVRMVALARVNQLAVRVALGQVQADRVAAELAA